MRTIRKASHFFVLNWIVGLEWSQTFQPFPAGRYRTSTIPALQKPESAKLLGVQCGTQVNFSGWGE